MRLKAVFTVAGLTVLGFAALALAQQRPPDGQPGRGRGGPPGGGGFMFGGGGGMFASRMGLLRIAEVRKELDLVDEQVAAIEKIEEEMRTKYPSPFGGRGPGGPGGGDGQRERRGPGNNNEGAIRTPTQWYFVQAQAQEQPGQGRRPGGPPQFTDEQRAEFEKQRAERSREEKSKLAEVLLPEQMKRLTEIYVQQAGINALQDEEIAKELGVSDAQKAKLAQVRQQNQESFTAAMREMFQGGGGNDANRDANRAKMEDFRKANDAKLLAVLSGDQQKKFEEMKGKPFDMPEGAGRGGPPGGPGGNRGRRGGDN